VVSLMTWLVETTYAAWRQGDGGGDPVPVESFPPGEQDSALRRTEPPYPAVSSR